MKNLFPICKGRDVPRLETSTEHQITEPENKLSKSYDNKASNCIEKVKDIQSSKGEIEILQKADPLE